MCRGTRHDLSGRGGCLPEPIPLLHHEMHAAVWRDHAAVQVIIDMYTNAATTLSVNGEEFDGFGITGGVRQGRPLSGSIFVFFFHTLLSEIDVQISADNLRMTINVRPYAFANDLAILTANL